MRSEVCVYFKNRVQNSSSTISNTVKNKFEINFWSNNWKGTTHMAIYSTHFHIHSCYPKIRVMAIKAPVLVVKKMFD